MHTRLELSIASFVSDCEHLCERERSTFSAKNSDFFYWSNPPAPLIHHVSINVRLFTSPLMMWYVSSRLCVGVFALPNEWMNKICEKSSISLKFARVLIFLTFPLLLLSYIKVSTSTGVISHFVNLQVVVPEAFILGSGELHVDMGSAINLVCIIEKVRTRDSTGFSPFSYSKKRRRASRMAHIRALLYGCEAERVSL